MNIAKFGLMVFTLLPHLLRADGPTDEPVTPTTVQLSGSSFHHVLEAEQLDSIVAPMVVERVSTASRERCLRIPPGQPKTAPKSGQATMTISTTESSTAYLWFRVYWTGSCSNSLQVDAPRRPPTVVEDSTYHVWHWLRMPPVSLSTGLNTITIRQREPGIGLDQVLLTSDKEMIPMGIEN